MYTCEDAWCCDLLSVVQALSNLRTLKCFGLISCSWSSWNELCTSFFHQWSKRLLSGSYVSGHVNCSNSHFHAWHFQYCLQYYSLGLISSSFYALTGLIAASCGQLDAWLQTPRHPGKLTPRDIPSHGTSPSKIYQNGNRNKPAKTLLEDSLHPNGNGVHV